MTTADQATTSPATMATTAAGDDLDRLVALNPVEIDLLPWEPLPGSPGAHLKVLWRFGDIVQGLLHYTPGATSAGEPHLAAHHHIWVVSGAVTIAGRRLTAGSYIHVPPGVAHPTTDVGPEGCTLLLMYRPNGPQIPGRPAR
jgi:hypothetical protein